MPRTSPIVPVCAALAAMACPVASRADSPYVVLRDDGTIEDNAYRTASDVTEVANVLVDGYRQTDAPLPEVMSVWSAFPLAGQSLFTLYLPLGNAVAGIGLDGIYGGSDGTFPSPVPPLQSILLHNDVTDLVARAGRHDAPVEGYGRYLFLLELSHMWGPALRVPGDAPDALIGFPFHWSFWMDAGGSPAGGNTWLDNGDGTFTTAEATPGSVRYSMLDLYLLGLADASEVPPFGLLEETDPPAITDPINGGGISGSTFPWFSAEPLTVTARRRTLTIDDVIAANGTRRPAHGEAPDTLTVGIVLVVRQDVTDDDLAALRREFDPFAASLGPAFEDATRGRGHLEIVTMTPGLEPDPVDAGVEAPDAATDEPDAAVPADDAGPAAEPGRSSSGCSTVPARGETDAPLALALAFAAILCVRATRAIRGSATRARRRGRREIRRGSTPDRCRAPARARPRWRLR